MDRLRRAVERIRGLAGSAGYFARNTRRVLTGRDALHVIDPERNTRLVVDLNGYRLSRQPKDLDGRVVRGPRGVS